MQEQPNAGRNLLIMLLLTIPVAAFVGAEFFGLMSQQGTAGPRPIAPPPPHLGLPGSGIDYYQPSTSLPHCDYWEWLRTRCFRPDTSSTHSKAGARTVLGWDLDFVKEQHLGDLLRVWVSLDGLMKWRTQSGFAGFVDARLRNLDTALRMFGKRRLKVDLVLYAYERGSGWSDQFRPQSLDGQHTVMLEGYLTALRRFIIHLASNKIDAETVQVVDLMNEPYLQLERYFDASPVLGMYTTCATKGGNVSSACVDERIIHPWLKALYRTARAASHRFLYTESDSSRLLNLKGKEQSRWIAMYPVDLYDIHLYDSTPWKHRSLLATALRLRKPWFSGEVGCDSGAIACTYDGVRAAAVDRWWLSHVAHYRGQSVLLENRSTVWTYPSGRATLTRTGHILQCHVDPGTPSCHNGAGR